MWKTNHHCYAVGLWWNLASSFFFLLYARVSELSLGDIDRYFYRCDCAPSMRQFAIESLYQQRGTTNCHGYGIESSRDSRHSSCATTAFHVRTYIVLPADRLDAHQPRFRHVLVGLSRIVALDGWVRWEYYGGRHCLSIRALVDTRRARDPGQEGRRLHLLVDVAPAFEILAKF